MPYGISDVHFHFGDAPPDLSAYPSKRRELSELETRAPGPLLDAWLVPPSTRKAFSPAAASSFLCGRVKDAVEPTMLQHTQSVRPKGSSNRSTSPSSFFGFGGSKVEPFGRNSDHTDGGYQGDLHEKEVDERPWTLKRIMRTMANMAAAMLEAIFGPLTPAQILKIMAIVAIIAMRMLLHAVLKNGVKAISGGLAMAAQKAGEGAKAFSAGMGKVAGKISAGVGGLASAAGKGMKKVAAGVTAGAKLAAKGIKAGAKLAAKGIKAGAKLAAKGAKAAAKYAKKGAIAAAKGLKAGAKALGRGMKAAARGAVAGLKALGRGAKRAGKALGKFAKKAGKAMVAGLKKGLKTLGKGLKKLGKGVLAAGRAMKKGLKAAGRAMKKGIKAGIHALKNLKKPFDLGEVVRGAARGLKKGMIGLGKAIYAGAKAIHEARPLHALAAGVMAGAKMLGRGIIGGAKMLGKGLRAGYRGMKHVGKGMIKGAKMVGKGLKMAGAVLGNAYEALDNAVKAMGRGVLAVMDSDPAGFLARHAGKAAKYALMAGLLVAVLGGAALLAAAYLGRKKEGEKHPRLTEGEGGARHGHGPDFRNAAKKRAAAREQANKAEAMAEDAKGNAFAEPPGHGGAKARKTVTMEYECPAEVKQKMKKGVPLSDILAEEKAHQGKGAAAAGAVALGALAHACQQWAADQGIEDQGPPPAENAGAVVVAPADDESHLPPDVRPLPQAIRMRRTDPRTVPDSPDARDGAPHGDLEPFHPKPQPVLPVPDKESLDGAKKDQQDVADELKADGKEVTKEEADSSIQSTLDEFKATEENDSGKSGEKSGFVTVSSTRRRHDASFTEDKQDEEQETDAEQGSKPKDAKMKKAKEGAEKAKKNAKEGAEKAKKKAVDAWNKLRGKAKRSKQDEAEELQNEPDHVAGKDVWGVSEWPTEAKHLSSTAEKATIEQVSEVHSGHDPTRQQAAAAGIQTTVVGDEGDDKKIHATERETVLHPLPSGTQRNPWVGHPDTGRIGPPTPRCRHGQRSTPPRGSRPFHPPDTLPSPVIPGERYKTGTLYHYGMPVTKLERDQLHKMAALNSSPRAKELHAKMELQSIPRQTPSVGDSRRVVEMLYPNVPENVKLSLSPDRKNIDPSEMKGFNSLTGPYLQNPKHANHNVHLPDWNREQPYMEQQMQTLRAKHAKENAEREQAKLRHEKPLEGGQNPAFPWLIDEHYATEDQHGVFGRDPNLDDTHVKDIKKEDPAFKHGRNHMDNFSYRKPRVMEGNFEKELMGAVNKYGDPPPWHYEKRGGHRLMKGKFDEYADNQQALSEVHADARNYFFRDAVRDVQERRQIARDENPEDVLQDKPQHVPKDKQPKQDSFLQVSISHERATSTAAGAVPACAEEAGLHGRLHSSSFLALTPECSAQHQAARSSKRRELIPLYYLDRDGKAKDFLDPAALRPAYRRFALNIFRIGSMFLQVSGAHGEDVLPGRASSCSVATS